MSCYRNPNQREYKSFQSYSRPRRRNRDRAAHVFDDLVLSKFPCMQYPKGDAHSSCDFDFRDHRVDLTHLQVFTIDPKGCDDVDDGFSIEQSKNVTMLHVHICDPTSFFKPWDSVFESVLKNGTSYHPSGRATRHMFTRDFATRCSLKRGFRRALTMTFTFVEDILLSTTCRMSFVSCISNNHLSYDYAARCLVQNHVRYAPILRRALELADLLFEQRKHVTCFGKFAYLYLSYPRVGRNDKISLVRDSLEKISIKRAVAIFSIATNGTVAQWILKLNEKRSSSPVAPKMVSTHILPYTHFTSPLRRLEDCIVHFEIKRIISQCPQSTLSDASLMLTTLGDPVFDSAAIDKLSSVSGASQRKHRSLIRNNTKFRLLQYIHQRLHLDGANRVRIFAEPQKLSRSSARLLINHVDGHSVHFTYYVYFREGIAEANPGTFFDKDRMPIPSCNVPHSPDQYPPGRGIQLDITQCNLPSNEFNNHCLPQLDTLFVPVAKPSV